MRAKRAFMRRPTWPVQSRC